MLHGDANSILLVVQALATTHHGKKHISVMHFKEKSIKIKANRCSQITVQTYK